LQKMIAPNVQKVKGARYKTTHPFGGGTKASKDGGESPRMCDQL